MPSPDERLQELRRQRGLVQEQLAFLDREIASVSGEAKPALQSPQPVPTVHLQTAAPAVDDGKVADLIKSLQEESRSDLAKARWGCIWLFVAVLVLFALGVFAFYLYVRFHQTPPVH